MLLINTYWMRYANRCGDRKQRTKHAARAPASLRETRLAWGTGPKSMGIVNIDTAHYVTLHCCTIIAYTHIHYSEYRKHGDVWLDYALDIDARTFFLTPTHIFIFPSNKQGANSSCTLKNLLKPRSRRKLRRQPNNNKRKWLIFEKKILSQ